VILLIKKHLAQAAQSTQAEHKGVNQ